MSTVELARFASERLDAIVFHAATDGGTRVRITRDAEDESHVRRLLEQIDPTATAVVGETVTTRPDAPGRWSA